MAMHVIGKQSLLFVAVIAGTLVSNCMQAGISYRNVALSGKPAKGTELGTNYLDFLFDPVINTAGQVAFHSFISGPRVTGANNNGIWIEGKQSLQLVARAGDSAPGVQEGVSFGVIGRPNVNDAGDVAFMGGLEGVGVSDANNIAIWSGGVGSLGLVVRKGDGAPGAISDEVYSSFSSLVFNNVGQTAFTARLSGSNVLYTNSTGIWSGSASGLELIAREGDFAPGAAPDLIFSGLQRPVLNDRGYVAFNSRLVPSYSSTLIESGIWISSSGELIPVTLSGDLTTVPRVAGYPFDGYSSPTINTDNSIAFGASVQGRITEPGVWIHRKNEFNLIAHEGDYAPGIDGYKFGSFPVPFKFSNIAINDSGHSAFYAYAGGRLNGGGSLWLADGDSLNAIAIEYGVAPGTTRRFGFLEGPIDTYYPLLNNAGQVAFKADLLSGIQNEPTRFGIWATDPSGVLRLVALEGEMFDVNDDPLITELREVFSVDLAPGSGGADGLPTAFNDVGELVFRLGFTDGSSGIFVASIPEPGSLLIGIVGVACLFRRGPGMVR